MKIEPITNIRFVLFKPALTGKLKLCEKIFFEGWKWFSSIEMRQSVRLLTDDLFTVTPSEPIFDLHEKNYQAKSDGKSGIKVIKIF